MAPMTLKAGRPAVQQVRWGRGHVWYVTLVDDDGREIFGPTPYLDWPTALRMANRLARRMERFR